MLRRKHKLSFGFFMIFFIILTCSGHGPASGTSAQAVISMDLAAYRAYLDNGQPPLDRLFRLENTLYFLVSGRDLGRLAGQGTNFSEFPADGHFGRIAPESGNGLYHSHIEVLDQSQSLADNHPQLAQTISIGTSLEGRSLQVIKISDNVSQEEFEPNIFIVGCHHGREWISVEVPLLFAEYLLVNYAVNPRVRRIVDGCQIYILPVQNPDGLEFSIHYHRMWRKNRRYSGDYTWGVDPNRNYGFAWGHDDIGSSPEPYSGVYRGPAPFSEPGTQAVRDFLLAHPPAGSLNFHNFSQFILYPWGYTEAPSIHEAEFAVLAAAMSDLIYQTSGRVYTYGPGATTIYPTNGDTDDWIYGTFAAPAFTIELPPESFLDGGFITDEDIIASVVAEMRPAMLHFIEHVMKRQPAEKQPE